MMRGAQRSNRSSILDDSVLLTTLRAAAAPSQHERNLWVLTAILWADQAQLVPLGDLAEAPGWLRWLAAFAKGDDAAFEGIADTAPRLLSMLSDGTKALDHGAALREIDRLSYHAADLLRWVMGAAGAAELQMLLPRTGNTGSGGASWDGVTDLAPSPLDFISAASSQPPTLAPLAEAERTSGSSENGGERPSEEDTAEGLPQDARPTTEHTWPLGAAAERDTATHLVRNADEDLPPPLATATWPEETQATPTEAVPAGEGALGHIGAAWQALQRGDVTAATAHARESARQDPALQPAATRIEIAAHARQGQFSRAAAAALHVLGELPAVDQPKALQPLVALLLGDQGADALRPLLQPFEGPSTDLLIAALLLQPNPSGHALACAALKTFAAGSVPNDELAEDELAEFVCILLAPAEGTLTLPTLSRYAAALIASTGADSPLWSMAAEELLSRYESPYVLTGLAHGALARTRFAQAQQLASIALALGHQPAYLVLLAAQVMSGETFDQAALTRLTSVEELFVVARCCNERGDQEGVLLSASEALRRQPTDTAVLLELSDMARRARAVLATLVAPAEDTRQQASQKPALSIEAIRDRARRTLPDDDPAGPTVEAMSREQRRAVVTELELLLKREPKNAEALAWLDELLQPLAQHRKRVGVIQQRLELAHGEAEREALLLRLASAYEALGANAELAGTVNQLLLRPGVLEDGTVAFCARYLEQCRSYGRLLQLLERQLEQLQQTDSARLQILLKYAEIQGKVGRAEESSRTLVVLLSEQPRDTWAMLDRTMESAGQLEALADAYQRRAEELEGPPQQAEMLTRAAAINAKRGNRSAAEQLYERAYRIDPGNRDAFNALRRTLVREKSFQRLIDLMYSRARHLKVPHESARHLIHAARLAERLGDVELALEIYEEAHRVAPRGAKVLSSLGRIYEATGAWDAFVRTVRLQLEQETRPTEQAKLHFRLGSVLETEYNDRASARQHYEHAVALDDRYLPALHGLQDLATNAEDWPAVVDALRQEAKAWQKPSARASIFARIGEVYRHRMGDIDQALAAYSQAIKTDKECTPAAYALFDIYAERGETRLAASWGEVCARHKNLRRSGADEPRFYARWIELLAGNGQTEEALRALDRAIAARAVEPSLCTTFLNLCSQNGEDELLRPLLPRLRDVAPRERDAQDALALAEARMDINRGRFESALALVSAIENPTFASRAAFCRAEVELILGHETAALEAMSKTASLPGAPGREALLWLARHHARNGRRPKAALKCYEQLLAQQDDPSLRLEFSEVLTLQGAHPQSLEQAEHALQSARASAPSNGKGDSSLVPFLHRFALCAWRNGTHAVAKEAWTEALALQPDFVPAYIGMSRMVLEGGEEEAALHQLRLAEQASESAQSEIYRLQAELHFKLDDSRRSLVLLRKARRAAADALDTALVAQAMTRNGHQEHALPLLEQALAEAPGAIVLYEALQQHRSIHDDDDSQRRAAQVVASASGTDVDSQRLAQVTWSPSGLDHLLAPLANSPLAGFCELIDELWPEPATDTTPASEELRLAAAVLGPPLGVRAKVLWCQEQRVPLRARGSLLMLAPSLAGIPAPRLAPLLIQGLLAIRNGRQRLLGRGATDERWFEARLGELLDPSLAPAELSRRNRKFLAGLRKDLGPSSVSRLVPWLRLNAELGTKLALLATRDFDACARCMALERGFGLAAFEESASPFSALEEVQALAHYYASPQFRSDAALLTKSE